MKGRFYMYNEYDDIQEIIKQWEDEVGITDTVLYKYDYGRNKLVIYTTRPGILIGYNGATIKKYESLLRPRLLRRFGIYGDNNIPDDEYLIEFVDCNGAVC